jgi:hypothetical protein
MDAILSKLSPHASNIKNIQISLYPPEKKKPQPKVEEKALPKKASASLKKEPHPSFGNPAALNVEQKKPHEYVREPTTENNKGWAVKEVNGRLQVKQPIAAYQYKKYANGSEYTLLEIRVGSKKVRVLGMGTYEQAKLEDGSYNEKDGLTTRTGFSPFTHVVYLEVL